MPEKRKGEAGEHYNVLVCGGRNFADGQLLEKTLNGLNYEIPIRCIIQGGAMGADRLAKNWAMAHGIPMIEVPANWNKFGRSAGHMRNESMVRCCQPDIVIAFEGGRGTENMVRLAKQHGIEVRIIG